MNKLQHMILTVIQSHMEPVTELLRNLLSRRYIEGKDMNREWRLCLTI